MLYDFNTIKYRKLGARVSARLLLLCRKTDRIQRVGELARDRDSRYGELLLTVEVVSKTNLAADIVVINIKLKSRHGNALEIGRFVQLLVGKSTTLYLAASKITRSLFAEVLRESVASEIGDCHTVLNDLGVDKSSSVAVEESL